MVMPKPPSRADLLATLRHRAAVIFVVLQVAVALAVVANATFIIAGHVRTMQRHSGVESAGLFSFTQQWLDVGDVNSVEQAKALNARQEADLRAIRDVPSVANAAAISTLPLTNNLWTTYVAKGPSTAGHGVLVSLYNADERARSTLGLKLLSGRDFRADEIVPRFSGANDAPPVVMVTAHLAQRLFGDQPALGRLVYLNKGATPSRIIGVLDTLQSPAVYQLSDGSIWDSVLLPVRTVSAFTRYIVRARPGQIDQATTEVKQALYRIDLNRLMTDGSVYKFSDIELDAYQVDRAVTYTMIAISLIMILIAGGGVFALTSLWARRRLRSLGVRRALGARRIDIVALVLGENIFVVAAGCVLGILLATGLNMLLMQWYEVDRISIATVLGATLCMMFVAQIAALQPALKSAASDPGAVMRLI
ncbi:ABC transporter permease [Rhodanobacter sp. Col0626]|uniref:ABC transporter permease n=1 Tax=Rhodanobacter sp. Col0626 TaxID=3415679 RepID=UPI003CF27A23